MLLTAVYDRDAMIKSIGIGPGRSTIGGLLNVADGSALEKFGRHEPVRRRAVRHRPRRLSGAIAGADPQAKLEIGSRVAHAFRGLKLIEEQRDLPVKAVKKLGLIRQ